MSAALSRDYIDGDNEPGASGALSRDDAGNEPILGSDNDRDVGRDSLTHNVRAPTSIEAAESRWRCALGFAHVAALLFAYVAVVLAFKSYSRGCCISSDCMLSALSSDRFTTVTASLHERSFLGVNDNGVCLFGSAALYQHFGGSCPSDMKGILTAECQAQPFRGGSAPLGIATVSNSDPAATCTSAATASLAPLQAVAAFTTVILVLHQLRLFLSLCCGPQMVRFASERSTTWRWVVRGANATVFMCLVGAAIALVVALARLKGLKDVGQVAMEEAGKEGSKAYFGQNCGSAAFSAVSRIFFSSANLIRASAALFVFSTIFYAILVFAWLRGSDQGAYVGGSGEHVDDVDDRLEGDSHRPAPSAPAVSSAVETPVAAAQDQQQQLPSELPESAEERSARLASILGV